MKRRSLPFGMTMLPFLNHKHFLLCQLGSHEWQVWRLRATSDEGTRSRVQWNRVAREP
jgi:hypothetical protein